MYRVFTADNSQMYREDDGGDDSGSFSTYEEALAAAKKIVDRSLRWERKQSDDPFDANELYDRYQDFGDSPVIRPEGTPDFSAWDYAKVRAVEICKEPIFTSASEAGGDVGLLPDYGLFLLRSGAARNVPHLFYAVPIDHLSKVDASTFSAMLVMPQQDRQYAISFDFGLHQVERLLSELPESVRRPVRDELLSARSLHRTINLPDGVEVRVLEARLGQLQTGQHDQFVPFVVSSVR